MKTARIDGIEPLPNDEQILRGLPLRPDGPRGEGRAYRLGIAGPDGRVYRRVVAHGFGEVAALVKLLSAFGFVEGPAEDDYRAVFHQPLLAAHGLGARPVPPVGAVRRQAR